MRTLMVLLLALAAAGPAGAAERLRIATTTSLENTGFLARALPEFEREYGVSCAVIAVGSGKALKLAENGDVDVLTVHSPEEEEAFMKAGFGDRRATFMYNHYLIAGPASDPAGVGSAPAAAAAFSRIAGAQATFISRADRSGTHARELAVWKAAGIAPSGGWYVETGRGMSEALMMASEKNAYTLTDMGSFLEMRQKLRLVRLYDRSSPELYNPYSVITLNRTRHPHLRHDLAAQLLDWLTGEQVRAAIEAFRDCDGNRLFHPAAQAAGGRP